MGLPNALSLSASLICDIMHLHFIANLSLGKNRRRFRVKANLLAVTQSLFWDSASWASFTIVPRFTNLTSSPRTRLV